MSSPPTVSLFDHLTALLDELRVATTDRFEDRDIRYQQRFDAQTKAIDAALQAAKEAVIKAEIATEKRFEAVNEFRGTLTDQAATFVSRAEFNAVRQVYEDRIGALTTRLDKSEGKSAGLSSGWSYIVAAVGVLGILIAIYANTKN